MAIVGDEMPFFSLLPSVSLHSLVVGRSTLRHRDYIKYIYPKKEKKRHALAKHHLWLCVICSKSGCKLSPDV